MKISVIIPCYNAADTIGEQLEALAQQQCDFPWEVIVADNGSTDGSQSLVQQWRQRIPQLSLINASNRKGPAHARNMGACAASGDVLLFCDADDVVGSHWLSAMASALQNHDFVAGPFEGNRLNPTDALKGRKVPQQDGLTPYDYPAFLLHAGAGNLGIKKHIHEAIGGFDESLPMLEDTDYCWRVQLHGTKLAFESRAILHMRVRSSIWGSLNQARSWGKYEVLLYKRFRPRGMPRLTRRRGIKTWMHLMKQMPRMLRNNDKRPTWLRNFARKLGRLEGSIVFRTWAL